MPDAPLATENWSDWNLKAGVAGHRGWMVTGVNSGLAAIALAGANEGSSFPEDSRLLIPEGGVTVKYLAGTGAYDVQADYTRDAPPNTNPELDQVAEVLPDFGNSSEPIDLDAHGNAITNSARSPFSSPVTDDFPSMMLQITQWQSALDFGKLMDYLYPRPALNSDAITFPRLGTALAGQLKLKYIRLANGLKANDSSNLRVSYFVEARGYYKIGGGKFITGFAKRILDQGREALVLDSQSRMTRGKIVPKGGGDFVTEDVLLDGAGRTMVFSDGAKFDVAKPGTKTPAPPAQQVGWTMPTTVGVDKTNTATHLYYTVNPPLPFSALGWRLS